MNIKASWSGRLERALKQPWLVLPPKLAHDIAPFALNQYAKLQRSKKSMWRPVQWEGLNFRNPLGIAGGVDKNGINVKAWWKFGVGFVEIGTVTPKAQSPNPPPLIMRDINHLALWNKLGFPNDGADVICNRLSKIPRPYDTPIFLNIGKQRTTHNSEAPAEYIALMTQFSEIADAFVVNISSPNTKGLRELLEEKNLRQFLNPIVEASKTLSIPKPVILKLSPDMEESDLSNALLVSCDLGIKGWILSNTTQSRAPGLSFPKEGGVSGKPLREKALEILDMSQQILGEKRDGKLIISVGGIMSEKDVFERLSKGADLIQAYSTIVFHGPVFFDKVARFSETQ